MTFRVEDADGKAVAEGKDLPALAARLAPAVRRTVSAAAVDVERAGLTGWTFGTLPESFERAVDGQRVAGFPALVDEGKSAAIRVLGSREEAAHATRLGVRRLLVLSVPSPVKNVVGRLAARQKLALGFSAYPSVPALLADCVDAATDGLVARLGESVGDVTDEASFDRLRELVRADLPEASYEVVVAVAELLALRHDVVARASGTAAPATLPTLMDVREHVERLTSAGFVSRSGVSRLGDLRRYLSADAVRLDSLPVGAGRDRQRLAEAQVVDDEVSKWVASLPAARRQSPAALDAIAEVRWMVEELRVSLFAQQLGTKHAVSAKRIYRAMDTAQL